MRLPFLFPLALAACSGTQYFAPPPTQSELRLNVRADTVQVNEVSIPEYAINQEIPIQQADGSLVTDTSRLWADLPDRALQGSLTRHLNAITDAEVAAEPWPLGGFPEVEVSIFVEDMIVQSAGTLRFTGTYALARED
ncbi:MAG: ABC-type transport auxiliary lipoprotein family protein, partial [Pseudomonadota bacterium]